LTHLSLTGVQAFLREDLLVFCREAPPEFNDHQRDVFCVFSGNGVTRLRDYLNQEHSLHQYDTDGTMYDDGNMLINIGINGDMDQAMGGVLVNMPPNLPIHISQHVANAFAQHLQQNQHHNQSQVTAMMGAADINAHNNDDVDVDEDIGEDSEVMGVD